MPTIAVLSEDLINKIAAGEVVERPASVVKELGENALDAGARTIRISLTEGGLRRVQVEDDGCGMSREDAPISLLRHATSKLRDLEGLCAIRTQGFRGEALAAIASVSRFTLKTARRDQPVGTQIQVEGGGAARVESAAPTPGTLIRVEDLFFNTPARRKFMRRASTELAHSREAVVRLALSHPEVSFFLDHDGEPLFSSRSPKADGAAFGDLKERLAAILGSELFPHLVEVEERRLGLLVKGVAALPEYTLSSARGLYTFVNGRYVRDRGLNFAVQRAYRDFLPMGRQPVAALFIEMDPEAVDVNVHPQKMEVRFAHTQEVGDALFTGLQRSLRTAKGGTRAVGEAQGGSDVPPGAHYAWAVEQFLSRARSGEATLPLLSESPGAPSGGPSPVPPKGTFAALRPMGSLGGRFWICEGPGSTLCVVDPHAVFERLIFSELLSSTEERAGRSLISHSVTLTSEQQTRLQLRAPQLALLGLDVEPFGPGGVALSAPVDWDERTAQEWAEELSGGELTSLAPDLFRLRAARALACCAAKRAAAETSWERARAALVRLDTADFSIPCRHGAPMPFEVSYLELERRAVASTALRD